MREMDFFNDSNSQMIECLQKVIHYRKTPVRITNEISRCIRNNILKLVKLGIVKEVNSSEICENCGNDSTIFVMIDNDTSVVSCLDCLNNFVLDDKCSIYHVKIN